MPDLDALVRAAGPGVPRLTLVRVVRGLTQRELERRAGVPAKTVSHFESRRRVPDPATRARLALALDTDVETLFGDLR
jgi:transcriptional regulator with XRE-family HTH domain